MPRRLAVLCILVAFTAACSGDPPDKEMQQAQSAIDAAKAAGAERYAATELAAAQEALARSREAVTQRDYRLALSNALDSREGAENAAKESVARRNSAREEADRSLTALQTALAGARNRLKAAEAAKIPSRSLTEPRAAITTAERRVQEARTALEHGDYPAVMTATTGATADLTRTTRELDGLMTSAARRRR